MSILGLFGGLSGVHVPHRKNTAVLASERMPAPDTVVIPMVMHIGAPAKPVVKAGDKVGVGQLIAEAGGYISAPIHASVSGTVKKVEDIVVSTGKNAPAVYIQSDGEMRPYEELSAPEINSLEELVAAARASGVVGLGGAGFPTAVKLDVKDIERAEYLLINAAECEPYITSDTRTMLEKTDLIERGVERIKRFLQPKEVIFGVERNKKEAIKVLKERFASQSDVRIAVLPSMYPQGGEKVLIYNTTGRIVPEGKLPLDVGVVILNVTTLAALESYFETGMPLVEKTVTVDGSAVKEPKNVIVPIGTPLSAVFDYCGGFTAEPKKVLYGGPMMGTSVPSLDVPILKNTNAILAFDDYDAELEEETPCLRCGSCVDKCPMRLNPPAIAKAFDQNDGAALYKYRVNLCMECGACVFACPAHQPIVQRHKLAKSMLRAWQIANPKPADKKDNPDSSKKGGKK